MWFPRKNRANPKNVKFDEIIKIEENSTTTKSQKKNWQIRQKIVNIKDFGQKELRLSVVVFWDLIKIRENCEFCEIW